jgi:hypothetical protein
MRRKGRKTVQNGVTGRLKHSVLAHGPKA